ncbi:unnamed protein product [Arctia plantaginis]|uniref:TIL domain-containing protein n=1 Tax=Arctia plantaginis TaxID=874455 RepID=A0A8S1A676_ARCPL|nr:unnamed protein product [Arctia plantaginis]
MVLRSIIVIALATCLFVLNCDACDTEKCSTIEVTTSSDKHSSAVVTSKIKAKIPKKKKGMRCPKNEEFSICTQSISRAQFCSQRGQSLCSHDNNKCTKGCVCKKKYLRSNNGTCIPERQCDTDCGQNEVLEECPADCADDYCPTKDEEVGACLKPDQDQCPPPVCKCKFNYRRTKKGTCISTRDCPPFDCSARPNEEFHACPPLCPTDDCSQATPSGNCPQFGNILITLPCSPKCRCIKGYWRKNGICVPYEECPNICPLNEEYNSCTQATCRHQNCSTRNDPLSCPRIDPAFCKGGCVCKENYYRNKNGTCVPEEQCNDNPKPTCEDNEILDDCPAHCKSEHCPKCGEDNKRCEQPNPCPPPACKCRFNHRRAENGSCIPTVDCPPFDCSTKPNEQYTPCPPMCPSDSCGWPRITGKYPFRIGILLICNPKCQCKDGFGRLKNGTCVPFDECPDICPLNEQYNSCTQATCRHQNCSTRNDALSCPRIDPAFCKGGCVCKENYYRNKNGTCVPEEQCNDDPKPTCEDNEILDDCPSHCESEHCPKCEEDNKSVNAKMVYGRLKNGTCVPFDECPNICPLNEEYNSCTQATCRHQNCSTRNDPLSCPRIDPAFCKRGCVCKENYYRNKNGTCVPEEQCNDDPKPTCEDNEILDDCPSHCESEHCPKCEEDNKRCEQPNPCPPPACKCRFNHRRAENGSCIPTVDCPPFDCSTKPNEQYTPCPPICPSDSCGLPRLRGKCPFRIGIVLECKPKCQCKDGYGRLENGTCVPYDECPNLCPTNEEYNSCKKDCVCKENHYRNDKGVCVEDEKVPLCPNPNEEYKKSFISNCPLLGTCTSIVAKFKCDKPEVASCICKTNSNNHDGKMGGSLAILFCLLVSNLIISDVKAITCPLNEVVNDCANALCKIEKCSERGQPPLCALVKHCKPGCNCKDGYLRIESGLCIPEYQCPPIRDPQPA